jgi:hypothetical protein
VSETGWGEFEASLRVYFKDPNEAPLDLFHLIKLYPSGPPQPAGALKKVSIFIRFCAILLVSPCLLVSKQIPAVVAEQYEEIVFCDPSEKFRRQLMSYTVRDTKLGAAASREQVRCAQVWRGVVV